MPRKLTLLVALMVLIGAPLVVNLVSKAMPSTERADAAATKPASPAPSAAEQVPPPPMPIRSMDRLAQPVDDGARALVDTAPLLDPHGIEPSPSTELVSHPAKLARERTPPTDERHHRSR